MSKAHEIGKKRFQELSGAVIEMNRSSFKIEFRITRWMYWGLQWRGKLDYVKHYFRSKSTSATGHKYDWTSSRDLALLLYLFPLVDHLTFHHKLYLKEKALQKVRYAYDYSDQVTAPWTLTTLYGRTKCPELKTFREADQRVRARN
jgi:hypothetical protein